MRAGTAVEVDEAISFVAADGKAFVPDWAIAFVSPAPMKNDAMLPDRIRFQVIENLVQGNKESENEAEHIAADIRNKIKLYMIAPYSSELDGIESSSFVS